MREIKFRGLSLLGVWRYGNLAIVTRKTAGAEPGFYISNEAGMPFAFAVRPETVGQYTGLKDKNGRKIYEGDIVKWGHAREYSHEKPIRIAKVKINPDIQFDSQVGIFKFGSFFYADSTDKDLEIIGNIHENKELLQVAAL